jgi:cytidylate kinase
VLSIRGAITAAENVREEILAAAEELLNEIIGANTLTNEQIISIIFTVTEDLDAAYPAEAARRLGIVQAGLLCMRDMYVKNSLQRCIRVIVFAENGKSQSEAVHIYLREAQILRKDLARTCAVAIDGPSGVGKSTLAKALAKELSFIYVDTGAMYRAAAVYYMRLATWPERDESVLSDMRISIEYIDGVQHIFLNGEDVTDQLRTKEVTFASSAKISVNRAVREKLLYLQREIAQKNNVIMDGRDIGTRVLPWAQVKIYLDADIHTRTLRRLNDIIGGDYETVKKEIESRDYRDSHREHDPLTKAEDAIYLDTGNMSLDEVKQKALDLIREGIAVSLSRGIT